MSSQPVMMFQPDQLFASLGKKQLQIESLSEQLNAATRQIASLTKENTDLKGKLSRPQPPAIQPAVRAHRRSTRTMEAIAIKRQSQAFAVRS